MRFFSEKYRLIIWLIAILTVGFLATSLTSYYVSSNQVKNNIINHQLPLSSDNIYSEIQRDLIGPGNVAKQMAHTSFVQDWISNGEQDQTKIVRYLAEIKQQFGANTAFLVTHPKQNYYYAEGLLGQIKEGDPDHSWFFDFKKSAANFFMDIDTDKAHSRHMTMFINYKMFDSNQQLLGVTGVGIRLDFLSDLIENYEQRYQRHVYFLDTAGNVVLACQPKGNIHKTQGLASIAKQILSNTKTPQRLSYQSQKNATVQINSRYIPELKWFLVVEQNESEAVAPLHTILFSNLGISLLALGLVTAITLLTVNKYQARLEQIATHDQLSGLSNRAMGEILLQQSIANAHRFDKALSLIILDIDHFKAINDNYGHAVGDNVIRELGNFLKINCRQNDVVARWGGEEFLILMYDCNLENATQFCNKLCAKMENFKADDLPKTHSVTTSFGLTQLHTGETQHELLLRADNALYRAKAQGRNQVVFEA